MKHVIDYLPREYRAALERQAVVRARVLMALLVVLGIAITEIAFWWRGAHFEHVAELAEEHAQRIILRAAQAADFEDQHIVFAAELDQWTQPLELPRATTMLAALLRATPESVQFHRLHWAHRGLRESPATATFDLRGDVEDAHTLAGWLRALSKEPALPAVELRQSHRGQAQGSNALSFQISSKERSR